MRTDTLTPAPTTTIATAAPARTTSAPAERPGAPETSLDRLSAYAAGVGAAVLIASTVAWIAGDAGAEVRAILMAWGFPITGLGVVGLAARLERHAPRARAVLTAMLALGAAAGAAFGTEAAMVEHFDVDRLMTTGTPLAILTLGLPGPMFPLALAGVGVLSRRFRTLPSRQALLLIAAGVLFPVSRIPQIPAVALVADLALFAALAPVAVAAWRNRRRPAR